MSPHRSKLPSSMDQRGAVFLIMIVILVMGTAAFFVSSLTSVGSSLQRDQVTVEVLNQAKQALIAYAINSENNTSESEPRPGNLPCPDTDAPGSGSNYGYEESTCSAGAIGRLPWKTLGLPELKDSAGEPLWYSVSGNFRRRSMNANSLNSDTPGTLDVYASDGATLLTSASDKAVAVVFASGSIVGAQVRGTAAEQTTASNYLEVGPGSRNNAAAGGPYIAADKTGTFNDKLVFLKASELLFPIQRRVAAELKIHVAGYYSSWNGYPFAATFSDPTTANYSGTTSIYYGLYPFGGINGVGTEPTSPAWNAIPSISYSGGGVLGSFTCSLTNGGWTASRARCSTGSWVYIPSGVTVTMTGVLNNVGRGFWILPDINDINRVRLRNASGTSVLASTLLDNASVTGSLNSATGSATVVFSGTGKFGGSYVQRIELRDTLYQSAPLPAWFQVNAWHQVMYYATSTAFGPGGNHTCSGTCLTLDGKTANAVIIATGGALSTQTHPSSTLSGYLEGSNASPASAVYENRPLSTTFNDKVVSVAP